MSSQLNNSGLYLLNTGGQGGPALAAKLIKIAREPDVEASDLHEVLDSLELKGLARRRMVGQATQDGGRIEERYELTEMGRRTWMARGCR